MSDQGKNFYRLDMGHLISLVVTNRKKPSTQRFHESAFVKDVTKQNGLKDLVKNMRHLQILEAYKNKKPQTMLNFTGTVVSETNFRPVFFAKVLLYFNTCYYSPSHNTGKHSNTGKHWC